MNRIDSIFHGITFPLLNRKDINLCYFPNIFPYILDRYFPSLIGLDRIFFQIISLLNHCFFPISYLQPRNLFLSSLQSVPSTTPPPPQFLISFLNQCFFPTTNSQPRNLFSSPFTISHKPVPPYYQSVTSTADSSQLAIPLPPHLAF